MTTKRKKLGKWGEDKAIDYLDKKGFRILDRNVYTAYGEIDIVAETALENSALTVFIEVKTRTTKQFGFPEQAVGPRKREHILDAAAAYLQKNPQRGDHWRVDVIAVERYSGHQEPRIHHFVDVFS